MGWREYYRCLYCDLIFTPEKAGNNSRNVVLSHYQNFDPHERVAASKQSFFSSSLSYLSSQVKTKNRSILDIGCGFGYFLESASTKGWKTYGVEIADDAVQSARKRVRGADIFHGSLKDTYYSDESFDAITLWDVLVMVDSPFEELRICHRILKQRGIIGIRVRNVFFQKLIYRVYFPFRNVASWLKIKKPYVFHRYNFGAKSLRLLLHRTGFRPILITNSPLTEGDPYSHTGIDKLTSVLKFSADVFARVLFQISRGRMITGPSLLVWAEKL
jgi:2-polyprenyl-3-methyl-5-hydroxy-6-metoxy-1,4-benzoquinol methylase